MPPKNGKSILKGFSYSLSDEDLSFICSRLHYNYQDDLAQACDFFSHVETENAQTIRNLLTSAKNSSEFYDVLDDVYASVMKEFDRRGYSRLELV